MPVLAKNEAFEYNHTEYNLIIIQRKQDSKTRQKPITHARTKKTKKRSTEYTEKAEIQHNYKDIFSTKELVFTTLKRSIADNGGD